MAAWAHASHLGALPWLGGALVVTLLLAVALARLADAGDTLPRGLADLLPWLQGLLALQGVLLLLALQGLVRQQSRLARSVRRAGDSLGVLPWQQPALPRSGRMDPTQALDALASGFQDAMGRSDRRWRALADLSADWFWESDPDHRLSWLGGTPPNMHALGCRIDRPAGEHRDGLPGLEPAEGWSTFAERLAQRQAFRDVEFRGRNEGAEVWVAISGRPRHDAHGSFAGYEGVARDITASKSALERLAASEQRWSLMTGLASDWYWQTDEQHRLLPLAAEFNGRFPQVVERAVGLTRWDAYQGALSTQEWAAHRSALEQRKPFRSLKFEIDVGRGHRLWLSISGLPRHDAAGRFIGYHGVGRDVTVRRHAERLLERHNQELTRAVAGRTRELQQLNRDLEAFSRQLAHELRTPISHVEGLAQVLRARAADRLADEERHLIDLQVQAAQSMREIVDALMELARSAVRPMPMETVDVSRLAAQALAELAPLQRRATVQWHIEPGLTAVGSPAALRIVLSNLLGNAAKFTLHCERPSVRLSGRHDPDGRLRVVVQDNGAGFDPAQVGRLFVPFNRLHAGAEYHGTGIGLSLVQRIVERHGGSVAAHGEPGQGARFEFTLAPAP